MLARLLAILLLALPGLAWADPGPKHPTPAEVVEAMRACAPIASVAERNGGEFVHVNVVYHQEIADQYQDPSLAHAHNVLILRATSRTEIGNVEAYWHARLPDVVLVLDRLSRDWAASHPEDALDLSFERGILYGCFQSTY